MALLCPCMSIPPLSPRSGNRPRFLPRTTQNILLKTMRWASLWITRRQCNLRYTTCATSGVILKSRTCDSGAASSIWTTLPIWIKRVVYVHGLTQQFFYERWGDAPVHSIAASLFLNRSQIHHFEDIGYRHIPWAHCPANRAKYHDTGKCLCDPTEVCVLLLTAVV